MNEDIEVKRARWRVNRARYLSRVENREKDRAASRERYYAKLAKVARGAPAVRARFVQLTLPL